MLVFFELILGLFILIVGGELLVRGAVSFAHYFRISPLVIGLTIVSFGTSAPELLVSLQAAVLGSPDLAVGNVVGSNIANLALVLGATVLILPIAVDKSNLLFNWAVMLLATLLFIVFSITDAKIVFWEGCVLFGALIGYLIYAFCFGKNDKEDFENNSSNVGLLVSILLYLPFGAFGLYYGAELMVESAVLVAKDVLGLSEAVVGVTIVAFGTSLPELVASCVAALRNQPGISIGNLIGSNIFNLLAVLGLTSIVVPIDVFDSFFCFDVYWLIFISIVIGPILIFSKKIGRLIGVFLVAFYLAYLLLVL
tara:strand:+ start:1175 stop:2104 length:930 start_codon:yes stop_codon:yes gene_type:complete